MMLVRSPDARRTTFHSSEFIWETLSRHRALLMALPLVFLALALAYVAMRGSTYTASSRLVVDNRILQFNPQEAILPTSSISAPLLQSQVAILQSDKIALSAMKELGLANDPEFLHQTFAGPDADGRQQSEVLDNLQSRIHASRVGESYLIDVRGTSSDPVKAAKITNAVVHAYLNDQVSANAEVANSVSPWLRSKVASLGTTARVVSEATPPLKRDQLPNFFILALGLAAGVLFALTLAFALDWFDNRVKTREMVERVCGAECLGMLPYMKKQSLYARLSRKRRLPHAATQTIADDPKLAWALDDPQGHFAHALRNARAAILEEKGRQRVIIGVSSPGTGEGKSVIAGNLARLMAAAGQKVLLVDADPSGSGLTALLAPGAERGLAHVLNGENLQKAIWRCERAGLDFLPNPLADEVCQPGYLLSASTEKFFEEIARSYDWVFLDLPPLDPYPDVREAQPFLQAILLVVEWNKTSAERLAVILDSAGSARSKLIGVLLNKAGDRMFGSRRSPSRVPRSTRAKSPSRPSPITSGASEGSVQQRPDFISHVNLPAGE